MLHQQGLIAPWHKRDPPSLGSFQTAGFDPVLTEFAPSHNLFLQYQLAIISYHILFHIVLDYTMSVTEVTTLKSFPSFPLLPIEIQILIWKMAFADSEFLRRWVDRLNQRTLKCAETDFNNRISNLPPFWYWPSGKGAALGNIVVRGGRRAGLPISFGINRLRHTSRLARLSCLEHFKEALESLHGDFSGEIKVVEKQLAAMGVVMGPQNGMAACIRELSELSCKPKSSTALL